MTAAVAETATATPPAPASPPRRSAMTLVDASYDAEKAQAERLAAAAQRRGRRPHPRPHRPAPDRPDLAGVHAPADFAVDAVRWCA